MHISTSKIARIFTQKITIKYLTYVILELLFYCICSTQTVLIVIFSIIALTQTQNLYPVSPVSGKLIVNVL